MKANEYQVDGTHYQQEGTIQHWDYAASQNFDYFQGQITKYVTRWKKKNGLKDLEKAKHFIEKYIEIESRKVALGADPMEQIKLCAKGGLTPSKGSGGLGKTQIGNPFGFSAEYEIGGNV